MKFEPVNRQLLVAPCKDPRAEGVIALTDTASAFVTVTVLAIDEVVYPAMAGMAQAPRLFQVGNILYIKPSETHNGVILDNNQQAFLVHESHVYGRVRDVEAAPIDLGKKTSIVVPQAYPAGVLASN